MPRIVVLSDFARAFDPQSDERNARIIRDRHVGWRSIARSMDWDLRLVDTAVLSMDPELVRGARVCWIDMPLLLPDEYVRVWNLARRLAPGAEVLDRPEDVENVLRIDRYFDRLVRGGLPQPRTALVPVDSVTCRAVQTAADVRSLLSERLYHAMFEAGLDPHEGVFVRGYYGSLKSADPVNFYANNQADLEDTVCRVLVGLASSYEVAGLALREFITLQKFPVIEDGERTDRRLPFEMRLTAIDGRVIMASYHGPYRILEADGRADLLARLRVAQKERRSLKAIGRRVVGCGLPGNFTADVAFRKTGEPVLIELNTLYSSGYNVPQAHGWMLASLAAQLAVRAGYPPPETRRLRRAAADWAGFPEKGDPSAMVWE